MLMWEWQAGKRCTGVSLDPDRAIEEAEKHLAVGDSARVERVVAVLSFRTMSSFYIPTGHGWTATREARGPISWLPLLPLERTVMSHPSSAASRPDPDSGANMAGLFRWEDLERLRTAAHTILELADDGVPAPLEPELTSFKEHLERALLHLGTARLGLRQGRRDPHDRAENVQRARSPG